MRMVAFLFSIFLARKPHLICPLDVVDPLTV